MAEPAGVLLCADGVGPRESGRYMLHFRPDLVEESVDFAEATAPLERGAGHGGQAREFGVDERIDDRYRGAFVHFFGGKDSPHQKSGRLGWISFAHD